MRHWFFVGLLTWPMTSPAAALADCWHWPTTMAAVTLKDVGVTKRVLDVGTSTPNKSVAIPILMASQKLGNGPYG